MLYLGILKETVMKVFGILALVGAILTMFGSGIGVILLIVSLASQK